MKTNYDQYRQEVESHYHKASATLEYLLMQMSSQKFERIKELYTEVNLENTLKLMIRCKLAFESRKKVLQLFNSVHVYEQQYENLKYILEKQGKPNGEYIEFERNDIEQINKRSRETRKLAESVLKKA
jgi:hypothetical protein